MLICIFLLLLYGFSGLLLYKSNLIVMIMSVELLLLSVNLGFCWFSFLLNDLNGQLFSFFILVAAAAEAAVGLAILTVYYRVRGTTDVDMISLLKG